MLSATSPLERIHALLSAYNGDIVRAQTAFEHELTTVVPALSVSSRSGDLVRVRAMVQDNGFAPQIYISQLNVVNRVTGDKRQISTHFADRIPIIVSDDSEWIVDEGANDFMFGNYSQKLPVCCVELPAQTAWARAAAAVVSEMEAFSKELGGMTLKETNIHVKRKMTSDSRSKPIMVKLYGEDPEDLQLSAMADFVGILELSDVEDAEASDASSMASFLNDELDPFRSLPVLHCIFYKRVSALAHPLLNNHQMALDVDRIGARDALLNYLEPYVFGDKVAVEYLLVHLVSKIRARDEAVQTGNIPLNIANISTAASSSSLAVAIASLLPRVRHIPLSIDFLNKARMAPGVFVSREYWKEMQNDLAKAHAGGSGDIEGAVHEHELNVCGLVSGELQLVDRTYVIVDEVGLEPGTLKEQGVVNVRHIEEAMQFAQLPFAIGNGVGSPDHTVSEIPVDFSFLVLSQGKCLFDVACALPLVPQVVAVPTSVSDVPSRGLDLNPLRAYLGAVTANNDYTISAAMNEVLTTHFITTRKQTASNGEPLYTQEAFKLRMEIARNWSLLSGESMLTMEAWEKSGEMEVERMRRCKGMQTGRMSEASAGR